jgi:dTDP-4-amino-4,6-dideoxygalactose transaminase
MDPSALEEELRRRPAKAVVAVHLYGQAADLDALREVAERHGALLIEDAAQAHGALYKHRRIGSHGTAATCWSFYPSKNLGAFGDAGAVTTHDAELAERLRKLRNYGQATRYQSVLRGVNSRMDELQAALLRAKLGLLERWNERRRTIARRYRSEITNPALRPVAQRDHGQSCEHLFVVRSAERERLLQLLRNRGVEPQIHYPIALHEQPAYRDLFSGQRFEASERLCRQVLSLPLYPELEEDEVSYVIEQANRLE